MPDSPQNPSETIDHSETTETESFQQDQLYRALIEHSCDGIVVHNAEGVIVFASPSHQRIFGLQPQQLVGQPWVSFIHPEDQLQMELIFRLLTESADNVIQTQWRQRHDNGNWRWLEGTIMNLNELESMGGQVMYFRDITELRQREISLNEKEACQLTIIETVDTAYILLNPEGRILSFNELAQAWCKQELQLEPAEGLPMSQLLPMSHRSEFALHFGDAVKGQKLDVDVCYPQLSGPANWYSVRMRPVMGDNGLIGVCYAVSSISNRTHAEQASFEYDAHLAALERAAQAGSWERDLTRLDESGVYLLSWSAHCYLIFGLARGIVEIDNQLFFKLVFPEDHPKIHAAIKAAVDTDKDYSVEYRILKPDGEERRLHEQGKIIYDIHTGYALKLIGTVQDISG